MLQHEKTLAVATFEGLIRELCERAEEERRAAEARLQALRADRDPPG
jgi:hypothetical protein